jgi:hypothetical protein
VRCVLVPAALAATLLAPAGVRAGEPPPPDPRQGERLDGRLDEGPAGDPALTLPRLLLWPARAAAWLVLTPIDRAVGFAERHELYDRAYELMTSDDRLRGVRPLVRYQSDSAPALGLRLYDRRTLGEGSAVGASLRAGDGSLDGGLALEPPGRTGLRLWLGYDRRADAIYGGTAGRPRDQLASLGQPVVRYGFRQMEASVGLRRRPAGAVVVAVEAGVDRRDYDAGRATSEDPSVADVYCVRGAVACNPGGTDAPAGFDQGLRVARQTAALALDGRPHPRYASGLVGALAASHVHGLAGDRSWHAAVHGATGGVYAFGDHALGLRLYGAVVEPLGDAPIPFEELLSPTGVDGLRGLPTGRLRGRSAMVATAEYRWLLAAWLDGVLFVDHGNAFTAHFGDLTVQRFLRAFTSAGLGLVTFDMDEVSYWRSAPRSGVQVAVTSDGGLRLSFALHGW